MTWKKSNDGGLDYDVKEIKEEESFNPNPYASGNTSILYWNMEDIPKPLTLKERIKNNLKSK
jgi:hypothetical protein